MVLKQSIYYAHYFLFWLVNNKKGTLEGVSKIYFDINNSLSIIIVVSFSIIGIVFLLWELLR